MFFGAPVHARSAAACPAGPTGLGARKPRPAPPARGADPQPVEARTTTSRPIAVGMAVADLVRVAPPHRDRAARHGRALAPQRLAPVLVVAQRQPKQTRSSGHRSRVAGADPPHDAREPRAGDTCGCSVSSASLAFQIGLQTVRRYRGEVPRPPSPSKRTFLINHRPKLWACDFFTVQTATFRTLFVFFIIAHERRPLVHLNVIPHPTPAWVWRQLIDATPWGSGPRFLIRDRDRA